MELKFTKKPQSFNDSEKMLYMILQELRETNFNLRSIAKGATVEVPENKEEGD